MKNLSPNIDVLRKISKKTKFLERKRKIDNAFNFLIGFVFTLLKLDKVSLNLIVYELSLNISLSGLTQRFNSKTVEFFKKSFEYIFKTSAEHCSGNSLELKQLKKFKKIKLTDSTSWDINERLADLFPGFGGNASKANCKLQISYNLKTSMFEFCDVTAGKKTDASYADEIAEQLEENDLAIEDLGYLKISAKKKIDDKKAFFLTRLKSNIILYKSDDCKKKINLIRVLKKNIYKDTFDFSAFVKDDSGQILKIRVVVEMIPQDKIYERIEKLKRDAQKKNRNVSKKRMELAGYNLFITNISEEILIPQEICALYKLRWAIELLFKQFKSIIKIDVSSVISNQSRFQCELYSKLILVCFNNICVSDCMHFQMMHYQTEISFDKVYKILKNNAALLKKNILEGIIFFRKFLKTIYKDILKFCIKDFYKNRKTSLRSFFDLCQFSTALT